MCIYTIWKYLSKSSLSRGWRWNVDELFHFDQKRNDFENVRDTREYVKYANYSII